MQAVNGVGLVTLSDDFGRYYGATEAIVVQPNDTDVSLGGANQGHHGATVNVSADLSGASDVSDQPIVFTLGSISKTVNTNNSGHASASLFLNATPGTYQLVATFPGAGNDGSSFATRSFTIQKADTTLELSLQPVGGVPVGADTTITATVMDGNTPSAAVFQRSVYFVVTPTSGSSPTQTKAVITDFNGVASLGSLTLPAGSYSVAAYFNGSVPLPGIEDDHADRPAL